MNELWGLFLILLATFMAGGVLFIKIDEMNKLLGTKETVLFLTIIFMIGLIMTVV